MKKKYILLFALIAILGTAVTGCVIDRGYRHPYHEHHENREHHHEHAGYGGWD